MTLRRQMQVMTILGLALVALVGLFLHNSQSRLRRINAQRGVSEDILRSIHELNDLANDYLQYPGTRSRRQWYACHDALRGLFAPTGFDTTTERTTLGLMQADHAHLRRSFDLIAGELAALEDTGSSGDLARSDLVVRLVGQFWVKSRQLMTAAYELSQLSAEMATRARRQSTTRVFISVALMGLVICGNWLMVRRRILTPLLHLRRVAEEMGAGDLHRRSGLRGQDEIAALSCTLDSMAENLDRITVSRDALRAEVEERSRAEEALRKSDEFTRAWLNQCTDGVWDWNLVDGTEYLSPHFKELFGYADHELPNLPSSWQSLIFPEDLPVITQALREHTERGKPFNVPVRYRHKDGSTVWVICRGMGIRDKQGCVARLVGTHTEITQLKETERELEQAVAGLEEKNAEMERFTYAVSHDLKSPLITIQGFLGLLEEDARAGNPDRMAADAAHIRTAAARMQQLLDELLELSRIGRVVGSAGIVPMRALADEAVSLVAGRAAQGNVTIAVDPELPDSYGDRKRLLEVLQNLLDNAVKYMGEQPEPRVLVGSRDDNGNTVFFVRDNGMGIDPRYHDRVFGLFEKLNAGSPGSGVGLALAKRIVEVHGGRIWVESAGAGSGSSFCFTLSTTERGAR